MIKFTYKHKGYNKMYYQEKKTIASMISGVVVLSAYCTYIFQKYQAGIIDWGSDLKFWATTMLIFIGAGIVITILIQIIFHIINAAVHEVKKEEHEDPMVEDEMDKLINLKAMRISFIVVGAGFIISLVSLIMQKPPAVMLNIIYLAFHAGSLLEGFSQLYFYRRGV